MAVEEVKGDLRDIELSQIEKILGLVRREEEFVLTLPSGEVRAELEAGILTIARLEPAPTRLPAYEHALEVPGRTRLEEIGVEIACELAPPGGPFPDVGAGAVLDAEKLRGELVARSWRPGDRMTPLGMSGQKKLHDMFIDAKVPRWERFAVPVIADDEKIVWVPGLAVSELAKVDAGTRQVVRLTLLTIR